MIAKTIPSGAPAPAAPGAAATALSPMTAPGTLSFSPSAMPATTPGVVPAAGPSTATSPGTTATDAPVVPTTNSSQPPPAIGAWIGFAGVLLVAVILACWNVMLARRKTREEERARQRTAFAEALRTAVQYKEMPYAIRRRDRDDAGSERVRLSEVVREIQAELSYHQSWIRSESADVATAYDALVAETRTVAGTAMREAWLAEPITDDAQMNIGPDLVDVRGLKSFENAYTAAVTAHLERLPPWWCR